MFSSAEIVYVYVCAYKRARLFAATVDKAGYARN